MEINDNFKEVKLTDKVLEQPAEPENTVQQLNSIWNNYKSEHNTVDAEGELDSAINRWINAHKDEEASQSLFDKFNAYIKSGSLVRFFDNRNKFNQKLFEQVDLNKDGTVTISELSEFTDNSENFSELKTFANKLGIQLDFANILDSDKIDFNIIRSKIKESLNAMQNADKDSDNIITYEEVSEVSDENDKKILNKQYGIADGSIDNKQGSVNNCYLITSQTSLARKRPETYAKIFQKYSKDNPDAIKDCLLLNCDSDDLKYGDTIIRLAMETNGKVLALVIPRQSIIKKQREYAELWNDRVDNSTIGSEDPDVIALEEAVKMLRTTQLFSSHITGVDGALQNGNPAYVTKLLTGAKAAVYTFDKEHRKKLLKNENSRQEFLNILTKNNYLFYISFDKNFDDKFGTHSYYISDVKIDSETNLPAEFILTDSIDSSEMHNCSSDELLKHIRSLSISSI